MGLIRQNSPPHRAWFLRSSQWAGRDERCELRLDSTHASEVHASIAWDGHGWLLRDRNSTNGTLVNEERLGLAAKVLAVGDQITFGGVDEGWLVEDVEPPGLVLEALDGKDEWHIRPKPGSVLLPSSDDPLVTIVHSRAGSWTIETPSDTWTLTHGSEFSIGSRRLRALVPAPHGSTDLVNENEGELSLANAEIQVGVTRYEEEADLVLKIGSVAHRILDRVPLCLLVLLARHRVHDEENPPSSRSTAEGDGWLSVDEARRALDISPELLNVHVFRVRECIRAYGLPDADRIVERRKGRIRLGLEPSRIRVVRGDL